jgi:hypothetical protein
MIIKVDANLGDLFFRKTRILVFLGRDSPQLIRSACFSGLTVEINSIPVNHCKK